LAETGTWIAHCPTSNEALGSGRMPLERLREHGVRWVLATDVGAGPHLSLLDVVRAFLQVHEGKAETTAAEALCRATAIPGGFLSACDPDLAGLGTFGPGAPAHLVAFARPEGDGPDALVRALACIDRKAMDRAPVEVVHWGERAFASRSRD
jgi:guanine deaminase